MERTITFGLAEHLIPAIAGFIEKNYLGKDRDLSRVAVVFEGKRPALFLQRELARRIKTSFFPPAYFSIDEFIHAVASKKKPATAVSGIDATFTIYRIAQEVAPAIVSKRPSFAQFLPWATEIAGFIDQVDMEDIKGELLENVQKNAEIGYDIPESINALLRSIRFIRDAYHARLAERGLHSRGTLYRAAAEEIAGTGFEEYDAVLFCGFFYMNASEEKVIRTLREKGKAVLVFQGDRADWPVLDDRARRFGCAIRPAKYRVPDYALHLYSGYDTHSQAAAVREIVKTVENPGDTVLVLPETESLIPLLSELSSVVADINVSLGYPLKRSSLYSLLECVAKAQLSKKDGTYYAPDYLKVVGHPLIKNIRLPHDPALTRVLVHKLEEVLLGMEKSPLGGSLFVPLEDLESSKVLFESATETLRAMKTIVKPAELPVILSELHRLFFRSWEQVATFAGFTATLRSLLDTLVKQSFLTSYPLNVKAVERLLDLLEEIGTASFARENFPREDIFKIVLERLGGEMVSFSGTPLKGFQVLGMMESRALSFENVIVMDMNESVVPKLRVSEPLIPREVMLSLGLGRLEKEEEIQRYQFTRLINAAKQVHLVYCDDGKKEKSRFIEELLWRKQKEKRELSVMPVRRVRCNPAILPEKTPVEKDAALAERVRGLRYSATRVNTYLDCPKRFYYQYVLGLREKEEISDELDGAEIGIFIHDFLSEAFRPFVGRRPVIDAAFEKTFFVQLAAAFDAAFLNRMRSDAFLIREVVDYRMKRFLEEEKQREVTQVLCLEQTFRDSVVLGGAAFAFEARVDRIDRLADGSLMVIDYKTGSAGSMPAKAKALQAMPMERSAMKRAVGSFQMPLYVHLIEKRYPDTIVDAALYDLRTPELRNYFRENEAGEKQLKTDVCLRALAHLMGEITDPAVPFIADDEDRTRCRRCPYFYLCR